MLLDIFIKSLVIGFLVALPIGPIGILCIDITLNRSKKHGLMVGVGTSAADILIVLVLGLGLSFVHSEYSEWFRIIGGIFLCYLGMRIFLSKPGNKYAFYQNKDYLKVFLLSFFITLINPSAILLFAAIFARLNPFVYGINYLAILLIGIGIFAGSMLWWIILINLVSLFKDKFKVKVLKIINQISGLLIILFGIFTIF